MMDKRALAWLLAVLLLLPGCGRAESDPAPQTQTDTPEAEALPAPQAGARLAQTDAYAGMNDPDFWAALCAEPDAVRLTTEDIAAYNASLLADPETLCVDLPAYPERLSRSALTQAVKTYGQWPQASYYTADGLITGAQQSAIYDNLNLSAVADENPVRWGFAVRRAPLRTWPSARELYLSAGDVEYDQARESTLRLWEPLAVLHVSADGDWLLVQAYNYLGWVAAADVATTDRAQWLRLQEREYVTVRAARLALGDSVYAPELNGTVLTMGVRLPLSDRSAVDNAATVNAYAVLLPQRRDDGTLALADARVPFGEDVCRGTPALTDRALLGQAFRLLGQRYGWGGMFGGWDCSSICADAYAVFGVMLPRNSSRQVRTGAHTDLSADADADKLALLGTLRPGALLEIKGHMMFWLGVYEGTGYVLHATYGFQPAGEAFTVANSVIVSSVDVLRSNGESILWNVRAVAEVKNPESCQ